VASESSLLVDFLKTDATLVALLTGGIFSVEDSGAMKLTMTNYPDIYDGAIIKPCAFVRARIEMTDPAIRDEGAKVQAIRQSVEIILFEAQNFGTIEQAVQLIFKKLHMTHNNGRIYQYVGNRGERQAEEMIGVNETVIDIWLRRIRS
jgi:hypothetical protein